MSSRAGQCVYVNTSIVVRALNPAEPGSLEARRFLEECCSRYRCVYSSVHELERMTPMQRLEFEGYLAGLGASKARVDVDSVYEAAEAYIRVRGLSETRLVDVMHMEAANRLGCSCILAIDRFIRSRSRSFKLAYANHYTGCSSCSPRESGARTGTRRAYSSASSTRPRRVRPERGPGASTRSGPTRRSATARPRRGSRSSRQKPGPKPRKLRKGG